MAKTMGNDKRKKKKTAVAQVRPENLRLIPGTADEAMAPHLALMGKTAIGNTDIEAAKLGLLLLWLSDDVLSVVNERLAPFGISESKIDILMLIISHATEQVESEPPTPTSIAEYVGVSRATVTGVLDWLEKRGLVARKRHPTDRRSLQADITVSGRNLLKKALPHYWAACADLIASLDERDRRDLNRVLRKLWQHMKARPTSVSASAA
jgi:DNA-binding MarR family transcriptional regulator